VKTHDVVIRYMRFRPQPPSAILPADKRKDTHAINIVDESYNVVIDHCSLTWGIDEVFSRTGIPRRDDPVVHCGRRALQREPPLRREGHSMGMLIGADRGISIHHNLMAHNNQRGPRLKTKGTVDVVNNVVYNWGDSPGVATDDKGFQSINYIGNYVKKGPQSKDASEMALSTWRGSRARDSVSLSPVTSGPTAPARPRTRNSW